MMEDNYGEQIQMQILDFATTKRTEWEENHQMYSVVVAILTVFTATYMIIIVQRSFPLTK